MKETKEDPVNWVKYTPYDNFEIYHPVTEKLMCFCSKKRARWYLRNGLANKIGEKQIKLTFIPNGHGEPEELLIKRNNVCVVSGSTEKLTKHHVVPTQYRQHFPKRFKDKNSFDLVLLNRDKHDEYESHATELKNRLFNDYVTEDIREIYLDWNQGRGIYNCIHGPNFVKVPEPRQVWMELKLEAIKIKRNWTDDIFKIKEFFAVKNYNKHLVDILGPEKLMVLWKLHFLKFANPKHLPSWWKPNLIKNNKCDVNNEDHRAELIEIDLSDPELVEFLNKYNVL